MAAPTKKPKKKKKKTKTKEPEDPNAPPKPKRKTGLNKPLILSPALSALMDDESEVSYREGSIENPTNRAFCLSCRGLK